MAYTLLFNDEHGNELEAYLNDKGKCYIQCGDLSDRDFIYSGHIVLDKEDLTEFIRVLNEVLNDMP